MGVRSVIRGESLLHPRKQTSHPQLLDPSFRRGWTAIQLREGDNLSCVGAVIEDNKIGPAGEEWIEEVDGDDPEHSPVGRPLASGLSLACSSSTVQRNVSPQFISREIVHRLMGCV